MEYLRKALKESIKFRVNNEKVIMASEKAHSTRTKTRRMISNNVQRNYNDENQIFFLVFKDRF